MGGIGRNFKNIVHIVRTVISLQTVRMKYCEISRLSVTLQFRYNKVVLMNEEEKNE